MERKKNDIETAKEPRQKVEKPAVSVSAKHRRPMSKTKKKLIIAIVSVVLVLAILAGVLIVNGVIKNRPPELEEIRGRLEKVITASGAVNDMFWGEGLATYPRIYSEGFSFKDVYGVGEDTQERNISGFVFDNADGRTIVAYHPWMYFIPKGQTNGIYYDFEKKAILDGKPDDDSYYRFAVRTGKPREGAEQNAYLAENLAEIYKGEYYYYDLADFDLNKVFFYNEKDDPNYDYVRTDSGYLSIEDMKLAAEKVYSQDYLTSLYESMFTGMTTGSAMLYARYYDYEDTESGTVSLVKYNKEKGYDLTDWVYDFSTMKMVEESNASFVTVEVERTDAADASRRETKKLYFALEDGQWYLDSPSF